MESFDYTKPSELMIKNYNNRVNKLSTGKVNVIRSWDNVTGIGLKQVKFTMANRSKTVLPVVRHDLSKVLPVNKDGFLIVESTAYTAAVNALPGGESVLRENLANASGVDINRWWANDVVEKLWVMYGVFLPPQDYYTTNMFDDKNVEWFDQIKDYEFTPIAMSTITASEQSLGYTGEVKLIVIGNNLPQVNPVRNLAYIHNNFNENAWEIVHPNAAGGMEPIIDDILTTIIEYDQYDSKGRGYTPLSELTLTTEFIDSGTGGIITVSSANDKATGSFDIVVSAPTESTIDLSALTNNGTPGQMVLESVDIELRTNHTDHAPRYEYLTQSYITTNYPEYINRNYFLKTTNIAKVSDKTLEFTFRPSGIGAVGVLKVTVNWNRVLHLSAQTNIGVPGKWEITDPNAVTNSYTYQTAMDELVTHMATKLTTALGVNSINGVALIAIPQPNDSTPDGVASAILKPGDLNTESFDYFIDGELLVTYPDVGYVPIIPFDLAKVSNFDQPGAWEIESASLEDFKTKLGTQAETIISNIFSGSGFIPDFRSVYITELQTGYRVEGGWGSDNIKNSLMIYPYIK